MCVGAAPLVVVSGGSDEASQGVWLAALLAAAVTGVPFLEFPPARIFMGDAGSGFLGLSLVAFPCSRMVSPQLFWGWLILPGYSLLMPPTLLRRLLGDKV